MCANGGPGRKGGLLFLDFPSIKEKKKESDSGGSLSLSLVSLSRSARRCVCAPAFCSLSCRGPKQHAGPCPRNGEEGRARRLCGRKKRRGKDLALKKKKEKKGRSVGRKREKKRRSFVLGFGVFGLLVVVGVGSRWARERKNNQTHTSRGPLLRHARKAERRKGTTGKMKKKKEENGKRKKKTLVAFFSLTPRPPCRSPPRRARGARRAPWPWPSAPCATAASWGP